jgi:hypothetical protein
MRTNNKLRILIPLLLSLLLISIAGATSPTIPSGIQSYVPINLTNSQTTATPSPFQQMINITESTYSTYLTYNKSSANIEYFYANGTIIPAWIESNDSGKLITWVKTVSIPASSHIQVYLGFASKSTNILSSIGTSGIGEAPQLSPSYAEYDDGASVFNNYWNFAGTSAPTGWVISAGASVNNGLVLSADTATVYDNYYSTSAFSPPLITEFYTNLPASTSYNFISGMINSGVTDTVGFYEYTGIAGGYGIAVNGGTSTTNPATGFSGTGVYSVFYTSTSSVSFSQNYGALSDTITTNIPSSVNVGVHEFANPSLTYNWLRTRAYPPNGVMPSVTFGAVQAQVSLSISPNPATYGQSVNITATCVPSTDTCAIDYPSLGTTLATGTGSATYTWNTTKEGIGIFSSFYANDITLGTNSTPQSLTTYIPINIYYANATSSEIHKTLNTSGLYLIPKCTNNAASLSLGYCIGNIAYSTSTTLSGNIYVFGNITIDSGVTITENGHYLYATETFTNDGTITGGNNTNAPGGAGGDPAGSGTSITTSYAGSGGGGGGSGGGVGAGGRGGSSLVAGGNGGTTGATGGLGGSGSTPSAPTMSQSLAINMLNNITKYLSSPSGGGGGGSNGGTGAEGVFGVVIGGNKVIAGTISVNGNSGNGGGSSGDGGGGGGGSGAASILVIYNASYTAGTPSYTGGSGGAGGVGSADDGGQGGAGGNGQLITYQTSIPATNPINYYYPLQYNTTTSSNMINFNVSITNLNTNTKSYHSSNQSLLYLPNKTADYLLSFREQQGTAKVYLNTTFLFNTTTINSDFNLSSLFQYFPILAHTPTWTAKPSSWSIVVANEPITNQQKNTTKGEQFDSPNLAVSFANAIKLTYPFTSFYLNLTDNPKVQKNITLAKISVIPSATTPAAPTTRKIAFTNSYAAINGTLISPSTASFTAQALFNNYTFTIANNFNISTTNGISEYMQDSNYQNPTISLSNISLAGIKTNYFKTYNNFCPVTIGSNYSTFNQYFVDQAGEDVQYSVLQGSGYGAVGYYMIFQSQYNGSLEQVGSYKITSASPFDYPTEIENAYKFIFLSPNCQKLVYQTPLSLISSPYSITIPITANITLAPELRLNATCTTLNATAIQCSGAGYGPTIHFFTISIYNQSGVFGSTNKVIKQVVINASSYVKVITGLNTSENLKVVSSVNFGDPLNTTISTYYTQFQVHIINLYGMLGPIAMIIMLALMGMFIDGKALPFIGAPIILFVLWAFNIISLTLTYIVGFIIIAVIFIVLMSRDYK